MASASEYRIEKRAGRLRIGGEFDEAADALDRFDAAKYGALVVHLRAVAERCRVAQLNEDVFTAGMVSDKRRMQDLCIEAADVLDQLSERRSYVAYTLRPW